MGLPPGSRQVGVAQDFLRVDVPPRHPEEPSMQLQQQQQQQQRRDWRGQPQQRASHQVPTLQQQDSSSGSRLQATASSPALGFPTSWDSPQGRAGFIRTLVGHQSWVSRRHHAVVDDKSPGVEDNH